MPVSAPPFAKHLAAPHWCADWGQFRRAWIDHSIILQLTGNNLPDPGQLGGHLRRSFLGALGAGASDPARNGEICPWGPPCALDVFCREQLRHKGTGLPKPYILGAHRGNAGFLVTLRIFGMANDWGAAASDALIRGLRGILPWSRLGARDVAVINRTEDWFAAQEFPFMPAARLVLATPLEVSASGDDPAKLLVRGLYRIDALGRWCGAALEPAVLAQMQDAIHSARYTWLSRQTGQNQSPNRHAQARHDTTLRGMLEIEGIDPGLSDLLHLLTRTGLGRKTNEGLGRLHIMPPEG